MIPGWFARRTFETERESDRNAARKLLASNPDYDVLSRNYTAAKMDELYPLRCGPYFAEGFIEVMRFYMMNRHDF
jgi:hypothetical protein